MCHMCAWCQWMSVDDIRSPGTGVAAGCESLRGCWTRTWIFCKSNTSLSHLFSPGAFQAPCFYRPLNNRCRMRRLCSNHKKSQTKTLDGSHAHSLVQVHRPKHPETDNGCPRSVTHSLPSSLESWPATEPGAHQFS